MTTIEIDSLEPRRPTPIQRVSLAYPLQGLDIIKEVAAIAGLNVLRIINKPIAAVLANVQDNQVNSDERVIVVGFGGDHFDASFFVTKAEIADAMATA
ncbi:hypothetical protein BG015_004382 [Linnemannia schmuckeri]|uniref:Uncharacterized protein n=1 Tax=Linnemannia schmuckeri TaxID=64567 RepID=A0A9P5VCX2_9FUNG|nr:hypothetical protein BG015_004382 [Linnemannia schmuckeri]